MPLSALVQSVLARFGVQVRRIRSHHIDPFADQQALLSGEPVRVVFDVGASRGAAARQYRALFPAATIYCFEPTEAAYRELADAGQRDARLIPLQMAVGEQSG